MAFNLFGISIPTPSLPNPFASKPSGGGTGGRSGGGFKPPSLPKVTIPMFTPPKVSVPKFTPPKVELPKPPPVRIPKIELPKIELPKISPPKVEIPKPLTDAGGAASRGLDSVIRARDQTYEQGAVNIVAGNRAVGVGQFAGATAADVMLPMDAANVANKLATGRGGELTAEDYLWAGVDAIGLAAAPFTLGASYAVTRAAKGAKVAAKGAKAVKTVEGVGEMGKFSGAIKAARTAATTAAKSTKAKMPSIGRPKGPKMPSIGRPKGPKMPSIGRPKGPKMASPGVSKTRAPPKQKQPIQQRSAIPETTKVPNAPKQGGALAKAGRYVPAAAGLGVMGLTLGGMLGGGGGGAPPEEDPYGRQDDYPYYPWWMQDTEPYPYGYDEEGYPYPDEEGYYPAAYPDPLGLEGYGQDACEYLGELPGVGGVYEEAARRGLGLPAIIGTVLAIILIIVFLRSKKGKKMVGDLKKKVTGSK